uniref:Stathmin-like 3 n=1 Tax=Cyprinus carpio carpio TaxID=630221 RepID=A0A9J7XI29_CYPCA
MPEWVRTFFLDIMQRFLFIQKPPVLQKNLRRTSVDPRKRKRSSAASVWDDEEAKEPALSVPMKVHSAFMHPFASNTGGSKTRSHSVEISLGERDHASMRYRSRSIQFCPLHDQDQWRPAKRISKVSSAGFHPQFTPSHATRLAIEGVLDITEHLRAEHVDSSRRPLIYLAIYGTVTSLPVFIQNILNCVPKTDEAFTGLEQHGEKMISSEVLEGVPLLVLANKQDVENCLSVPDIKTAFSDCAPKIGKRDCLVQPCSALSGQGVNDGIEWMVKCVIRNIHRPPRQKDIT